MGFVVADASVLFACLAKDGRTRDVFTSARAALCAPPFLLEETQRLLPKAAKAAGVSEEVVRGVFTHLTAFVQVVATDAYRHKRAEAQERCREADAWGDDEYVALALALDAPVWTLDKDFARIRGVRTATTEDLDVA